MQSQVIVDRYLRSDLSHDLNAFERILLVMLASYMGNKRSCFPSHQTLARNCGISTDTVRRHIHLLENKQVITIKHTKGRNNRYMLNIPELTPLANGTHRSKQVLAESIPHHQPPAITLPADSNTNNINNNITKCTSAFKKTFSAKTINQPIVKLTNGLVGGYDNE